MESKKNEAELDFTPKKLIHIKFKLKFPNGFEFFLFVKFRKIRCLN